MTIGTGPVYGPGVSANVGRVSRPACAPRRVRPMQRLVYGKQVRQVLAVRVLQVVDPLDADGSLPLRLDRERGSVVDQQRVPAPAFHRAVSPDRRTREARREDLLRELLHRDLVVVGRLPARHGDRRCSRHHRGDQERRLVLGHRGWVEGAARDLGERPLHPAEPRGRVPADRGRAGELEEGPPGKHHDLLPAGICSLPRKTWRRVEDEDLFSAQCSPNGLRPQSGPAHGEPGGPFAEEETPTNRMSRQRKRPRPTE